MSKEKQQVFSLSYVNQLMDRAKANQDNYIAEKFPYEEKYPPGEPVIEIVTPVKLLIPDDTNTFDFENSKIIFESYKHLNETQGSDGRLWTYLAHVDCWEYMRKRWPVEKFDEDTDLPEDKRTEKKANYIIWHYFLKTANTRRLIRHGISRLWWYAYLTYDESRTDHYELTRALLRNLDITQNVLERTMAHNREVLIGILEYLKDNPSLTRNEIREKLKKLNLAGGVKILPVLDRTQITQIMQ